MAHCHLVIAYRPELDEMPTCDNDMASRFRQIIGIFRWAIKLGRFDILTKMSLLSQYQASPRVGHVEALYLIANFLCHNPMQRIVFDPWTPSLDKSVFMSGECWKDFYGDIMEEDPPDHMPVPLGQAANMACFVDADHTGNKVTRRSHTGIMIFLQSAPFLALSKCKILVNWVVMGQN